MAEPGKDSVGEEEYDVPAAVGADVSQSDVDVQVDVALGDEQEQEGQGQGGETPQAQGQGTPGASVAAPSWTRIETYKPEREVLPQEIATVNKALRELLPSWQQRINTLFKANVPLRVDIEESVQHCLSPQARLKTIRAMLAPSAVGLPPALEILVKAFETLCTDDDVKRSMLTAFKEIRVVNRSTPIVKGLSLEEGALVFSAPFDLGYMKATVSPSQIESFLEANFYCQERRLVNIFAQRTLPAAQTFLSRCLGHETPLKFDVLGMLSHLENPANRLFTTQTIVQETGLARTGAVLSDRTNEVADAAVSALEKMFTGKSNLPPARKYSERTDSPQVLLPLQGVIDSIIRTDQNAVDLLGKSIKEIHFEMVPSGLSHRCGLELRRELNEQPLLPNDLATDPLPKDLYLVYVGAFETGAKGCLEHEQIRQFFETFFRVSERAFVNAFVSEQLPTYKSQLSEIIGQPLELEVDWATIFHPQLPVNNRIVIARSLGQFNSKATLRPLHGALSDIVNKDASGRAKLMLTEHLKKIVITGVPGENSRPLLLRQPEGVLVYSCAFEAGPMGTLGKETLKQLLRGLFDLPVPADDGGVGAAARKFGESVGKLGDAFAAKFSSLF